MSSRKSVAELMTPCPKSQTNPDQPMGAASSPCAADHDLPNTGCIRMLLPCCAPKDEHPSQGLGVVPPNYSPVQLQFSFY